MCSNLDSIILPAGLEQIECRGLYWRSLKYVGIERGNRHFTISGNYLEDFSSHSIVGHVGISTELFIGKDIEELCDGCFCSQKHLSGLSFETDSRLRRIGECAFFSSSLNSIVIPSSVEIIGNFCFDSCDNLSVVKFESNSRLSEIGDSAFSNCPSLKTVWIPSCVESIAVGHFREDGRVDLVIIETGAILHLHE
jgi:hypothetical protein